MSSLLRRNKSMPASAVIPVLLYPSVPEAADWLCKAFGFTERLRIGTHRVQLNAPAGQGAVVVAARGPSAEVASACVMVRVHGVDALFQAACDHGATVIGPPQTHVYGERQFTVADPFGHVWTFSESVEDVDPASWGGEYLGRDIDET
jgi:uncharacterized glyoxalase superfamily protein PhnB